jgi:hypothetical protein
MNTTSRIVHSLQYICLKKIEEENPKALERLIAYHDQFEDLDYVLRSEKKFRNDVKSLILSHHGHIFGGALRDEILGVDPKDYDVFFEPSGHLEPSFEKFIKMCKFRNYTIGESEYTLDYFTQQKIMFQKCIIIARETIDILQNDNLSTETREIKRRLCELGTIQRYYPLDVKIDVTSIPHDIKDDDDPLYYMNQSLDMDVNQLISHLYFRLNTKVKMKMSMYELKKQIIRKEFKMYCETDSFVKEACSQSCVGFYDMKAVQRKEEMERRGWRCINKPCENGYCLLATEEAKKKYFIEIDLHNFKCAQRDIFMNLEEIDNRLDGCYQSELFELVKEKREDKFLKRRKSKRLNDKKKKLLCKSK